MLQTPASFTPLIAPPQESQQAAGVEQEGERLRPRLRYGRGRHQGRERGRGLEHGGIEKNFGDG